MLFFFRTHSTLSTTHVELILKTAWAQNSNWQPLLLEMLAAGVGAGVGAESNGDLVSNEMRMP